MIEVNEYVRTKNGLIGKVDSLYGMIENTIHLENQKWIDTKSIVKHSKNIVDIIEPGDYVNKHLVVEVEINICNQKLVITEEDGDNYYLKGRIESILTHEQYEKNCYKMEEEE